MSGRTDVEQNIHRHLPAHEDMGVMRPVLVMPARVLKSGHGGAHGGHGEGRTG
ncbi:hypothetical protein OR263_27675 [Streptomyces sp. NEAU-H22]|uniref:hypothetical protein n=1 Tax=unclassified Streptomyces TaxID=2593676 RepID=UPI0022569A5E|nr:MULTISPECIES: hypothetical protein [unclassified Streptomyces]MCX3290445.1 hypothetical protein [Streptomyces sp. NEAU-H22]WMD04879.1 hypothetical protein Q7C01_10925 [Streptomyces sp. FXY-T5]